MDESRYSMTMRPLAPDEGGGWLAAFPDLPGCMADGETPEAAATEARDALLSHRETLRQLDRPLPSPAMSTRTRKGRHFSG